MKSRILVVLFFAAVVFVHLKPISDPDLFWHLATGRWILEQGQLPDVDPFNYTTSVTAFEKGSMARVISRQYWLANILQYGTVLLTGYAGLLFLKGVFALLTMLMVYLSLRGKGLNVVASLLLLAPLGYLLSLYQGSRPNQMTFFFFAAFLYLIEEARRKHRPRSAAAILALPCLMMFWANVHGGFIFGAAIAGIYLASELSRSLFSREHQSDGRLIAVLAATILAGLLNPNGATIVFALIRETAPFQNSVITELMPAFSFVRFGTYRYLVEIFCYLSAAGISIAAGAFAANRRRDEKRGLPQIEHIVLVILFGFLSFAAVRFIPLLAIAATPVIGNLFLPSAAATAGRLSRYPLREAALVGLLAWGVWSAYPFTVLKMPLVSDFFPEPAVRFIRENQLQGRLFNYYDWGGFLIWRFPADKVVFADGRGLSPRAYHQYLSVIGADRSTVAGVPAYQAVLDSHAVRSILIPGTGRDGGLVPLIAALENNPEWRLVFYHKNCLLYTREQAPRALPKVAAYAIARESAYASLGDDPRPYLTIARTNLGLGRWGDAVAFLESALKQRPSLRGGPVERALGLLRAGTDILREDTGLP